MRVPFSFFISSMRYWGALGFAFVLSGCMMSADVGLPEDTAVTLGMDDDVIFADHSGAAYPVYDEDFDLDLANADIWQRIRQGFGMPDIQTEEVSRREQWYRDRPRYFDQTGQRARRYLYYIVEEIEQRGMPMELALLPFLESAYNPEAVSHANAAGMWQFIPSTGRNFELEQDIFRDDRRDVIASTKAALDYLQLLYNMFGDWHLALAAYNCGEGNVMRAIENNRRQNRPTDYLSLKLPTETQGYIPVLQALKNLIADPLSFRIELPLIADRPFFQIIELEQDMDVELIVRLAHIPMDEFKALNPAVNKPVVFSAITPRILLPWRNAEGFIENLSTYHDRLSSWTVWRAPSTMSISQVARATNMTEKELRDVNDIPPAVLVRQGSLLLIHRAQSVRDDVKLAQIQNASVEFAHPITGRRLTPSKVPVEPTNVQTAGVQNVRGGNPAILRNDEPSKVAVNSHHQNNQTTVAALQGGS